MTPSRIFLVAGIYGLLVLPPQYFLEAKVGEDYPPAITHPEYFYGFIGVAIAWQLAFLVIARDPPRYRLLMLPAVAEKLTFGGAAAVLFWQGRIPAVLFGFGMIDIAWGVLFALMFFRASSHR